MSSPSPNLHPALMAVATAQDILSVPARLWRQRNMIGKLSPAGETEIRVIRRCLRAKKLGCDVQFINARYRSILCALEAARLRFLITLLKTPDYLTALLLIIFRRRHRETPTGQ